MRGGGELSGLQIECEDTDRGVRNISHLSPVPSPVLIWSGPPAMRFGFSAFPVNRRKFAKYRRGQRFPILSRGFQRLWTKWARHVVAKPAVAGFRELPRRC